MVQRCLTTDGLGFEVFNVANADMSVAATTDEIREQFYEGVELRREMGRDETFYSIDKAREMLGFARRTRGGTCWPTRGPEVRAGGACRAILAAC